MKKSKKIFLLLIIILLVPGTAFAGISQSFPLKKKSSGDSVAIIQQRLIDLGYLHFRATGTFGEMTYQGVLAFQGRNKLTKDGMVGEKTYANLYGPGMIRAALNKGIVRTVGAGLLATPKEYGELSDWKDIDKLFPVGATATVTDFNTLRTFKVTRTGGVNHADVQTADSASQSNFLKSFGGDYTWEKRPALVAIGGTKYAASLFGMPNANNKLKNNLMPGSVCLYFNGSLSDNGNIPDAEHSANIAKAAGR